VYGEPKRKRALW